MALTGAFASTSKLNQVKSLQAMEASPNIPMQGHLCEHGRCTETYTCSLCRIAGATGRLQSITKQRMSFRSVPKELSVIRRQEFHPAVWVVPMFLSQRHTLVLHASCCGLPTGFRPQPQLPILIPQKQKPFSRPPDTASLGALNDGVGFRVCIPIQWSQAEVCLGAVPADAKPQTWVHALILNWV